jgi:hypothetical protein
MVPANSGRRRCGKVAGEVVHGLNGTASASCTPAARTPPTPGRHPAQARSTMSRNTRARRTRRRRWLCSSAQPHRNDGGCRRWCSNICRRRTTLHGQAERGPDRPVVGRQRMGRRRRLGVHLRGRRQPGHAVRASRRRRGPGQRRARPAHPRLCLRRTPCQPAPARLQHDRGVRPPHRPRRPAPRGGRRPHPGKTRRPAGRPGAAGSAFTDPGRSLW